MPRDIPVGNGQLLVTFDNRYQIRDIYFPRVGQENHAGAGPNHFGVHTDVPDNSGRSQMAWTTDPSWEIHQRYLRDTLTTSVSLENKPLQLVLYCNDTVDFHRNVYVRRIKVKNLAYHDRTVRGDAPPGLQHVRDQDRRHCLLRSRSCARLVHYRTKRYLMVTFFQSRASSGSTNTPPAPAASTALKARGSDGRRRPPAGQRHRAGCCRQHRCSHHVHIPAWGRAHDLHGHHRRAES